MTTTSNSAQSQQQQSGSVVRHVFIDALFALASLVPKILHIRHNTRSWMLLRIFLGGAGAALVLAPLTSGNIYVLPIAGLVLFVSAILLPPARPQMSAVAKARELSALVVVNGGRFRPMDATSSAAVQLFVGAVQISVLDANLQPLLEIPTAEMTTARAVPTEKGWLLEVTWGTHAAEFSYRGIFAERFARVAENTLQSVMRHALPVIPKRRAASA